MTMLGWFQVEPAPVCIGVGGEKEWGDIDYYFCVCIFPVDTEIYNPRPAFSAYFRVAPHSISAIVCPPVRRVLFEKLFKVLNPT